MSHPIELRTRSALGFTSDAIIPLVETVFHTRAATSSQRRRLQRRAIEALAAIDADDPICAATFLAAARDPDPVVARAAALALARCQGHRQEAISTLAKLLTHADARVRDAAAVSLRSHGVRALPAVPALVDALSRAEAARSLWLLADALGATRTRDVRAVNALARHAHHPDARVRAAVAGALGHVATEPVRAQLLGLLDDESYRVRDAASRALARIPHRVWGEHVRHDAA